MVSRARHRMLAMLPAAALVLCATACVQSTSTQGSADNGKIPLITPGKLTTCTKLPYEPFQFQQGGQIVGFDVELVDLVAADLKLTQQLQNTPFEGIKSGEDLNTGKCDIAAAGMTITETRKQNLDFSDPYMDATQVLFAKKGAPFKDLASLKGKKLAVQQDTTGESYAKDWNAKNGNAINLVQFEDVALLATSVQTGQVDAAIDDNGVLYYFANKHQDTDVTAEFKTGEKLGFGLKKGSTALEDEVNKVLMRSAQDGSYAKIYQKWFGKQPTWLPGQR